MFRILIVDDDPAAAHLLKEVMKPLLNRAELHFVCDGVEALDFLHQRGTYAQSPRPNLILLDINMPRLSGLETLSAIKSDPELYVIPVIMLSASSHPGDVRKSYQSLANCYLQKPADLERSMRLVEAIDTFWMDFVLHPTPDPRTARFGGFGNPIASTSNEGNNRAMQYNSAEARAAVPVHKSGCGEHNRLLNEFGSAVRSLLTLHEQQFLAIVEDDSECTRFDLLIHMANEKKQHAKYAYLRHVEAHGCSNEHDIEQART